MTVPSATASPAMGSAQPVRFDTSARHPDPALAIPLNHNDAGDQQRG